jgi:hypothetical protein
MVRILLHQEGRLAIVTKRGAGCGGREASSRAFRRVDERRRSPAKPLAKPGGRVRRSRVVLAPRSWRQVLGRLTLLGGEGGKKADHRGEHEISRKPLRREGRTASAEPVCSCACSLMCICTRDRGCSAHPVFPAPLFLGRSLFAKLGRMCRENDDPYPVVPASAPGPIQRVVLCDVWPISPELTVVGPGAEAGTTRRHRRSPHERSDMRDLH